MILGARFRDDESRIRVVRVDHDRETEAARQPVPVDPLPGVTAVIRAVDAAVVLLPEPFRLRRVQQQLVHALANFRIWVGKVVDRHVLVDRQPGLSAVIRPERARRCDTDVYALRVARVELDRIAAQPAGAGKPAVTRGMLQNATVGLPGFAGIVRAEKNAGIRPEVQRSRLLRETRLDVPDRVHGQPRPLGKAYLPRPLPRLAPVGRPLDRRAVDDMVHRRIDFAVTRIDRCVVNPPAIK